MSSVGSVAAPDNQHIKRLILACSAGKEAEVRAIVSEVGDWTSPLNRDALRHGLQRVAARGNVNLSQFLLEHGSEIDARRETEVAAIFRAAENGHVKITRMLVERTAYLEAKDRYGKTAIFPAASKGYIEVLKLLVGAGANINARDKEGKTVLIHLASEKLFRWNETICQYLLDMDADIEAMDITKRTALTWAADYGKYEMVKLLLEGKKKANVEA
jgi:ankyrin repeat protein